MSFDKGFHSPANQAGLKGIVGQVVLPRKGKLSEAAKAIESEPEFSRLRRQHSAVESAINALEAHGLDRCPDHGIGGFRRYVAMSVAPAPAMALPTVVVFALPMPFPPAIPAPTAPAARVEIAPPLVAMALIGTGITIVAVNRGAISVAVTWPVAVSRVVAAGTSGKGQRQRTGLAWQY